MIYNILLVVQILVALSIIGLVLIQHGKGADAGAAFGGGASGTVFGSKGSGSFLSRTTGILAAIFFVNSLLLAWLVSNQHRISDVDSVVPTSINAPATPAPADVPAVNSSSTGVPSSESVEQGITTPSDVPNIPGVNIQKEVITPLKDVMVKPPVTPPAQ